MDGLMPRMILILMIATNRWFYTGCFFLQPTILKAPSQPDIISLDFLSLFEKTWRISQPSSKRDCKSEGE